LWGLLACHHNKSKVLSYDVRSAAELFGQLFSFVLDQREGDQEREEIARARVLHDQLMIGNPDKPVELGPHGVRLTPRKSFEAWKQIVSGECQPWSQMEVSAAESLRITLLEVVLRIADSANKEQARSQERQEILIAELNHRVRNILNLIRSLISQTSSEGQTTSEFTKTIGGRIHALARAHDQITKENWSPASVYELISTETDAYLGPKSDRVIISGPDPFLVPTAFTTLSLVIQGLEAKFKIPPSFIHHFGQASANDSGGEPLEDDVSLVLTGEALLVEDNIIIAMDAEDSLTELGANAVNVAANVADALAILKRESISVALLDVNLGAETSEPIAEALLMQGLKLGLQALRVLDALQFYLLSI